jgi:hypothetical protein
MKIYNVYYKKQEMLQKIKKYYPTRQSQQSQQSHQSQQSQAYIQYLEFEKDAVHRRFTYFTNWMEAVTYMPKFKGGIYCNEIILHNKPCKPYLDIEYLSDHYVTDAYITKFIKILKESITAVFENNYDYKISSNEIYISSASCNEKLSLHVTVTTINQLFNEQLLYENNSDAKDLAIKLIEHNQYYGNFIDLNVYSRDKFMRIVTSCKYIDDKRPLIPLDGNNLYNYIITNYNLNEGCRFLHVPKFIVRNEQKTSTPVCNNDVFRLVDMLSDRRVIFYKEWMELGWCLCNISNKDNGYLNLWKRFSKRCSDKYDAGVCDDLWENGTKIGEILRV